MKKIIISTLVLSGLLLSSCSNDDQIKIPDNGNNTATKAIVTFDFEKAKQFYLPVKDAAGKVTKQPIKNMSELKAGDSGCGRMHRGKAGEFKKWKGYDFSANKTTFVGYDMGRCGGVSEGKSFGDFEFKKNYGKGELKLRFKYYKPGDLTGWTGYFLDVYLTKEGEENPTKKYLVKVTPKVNKAGWVVHDQVLDVAFPKGKYAVVIAGGGAGSVGIDDIQLYPTK